jgi:hypothetical protein
MKKIIQVLTAGLVVAGLMAACIPAFEPEIDVRYNLRAEKSSTNYSISVSSTTPPNTALQVQSASGGYPQRIILSVDDSATSNTSNFDIDAQNKIPGLSIHLLTSSAPYTLYTEVEPALDYSAYPVSKNEVELVMPFNDSVLASTATEYLVVKLDPAKVTFNGGAGRLNRDGDSRPGEAEEDAYFFIYTNITEPTGYSGAQYTTPSPGIPYYFGTISGYSLTGPFLTQGGSSLAVQGFTIDTTLSGTPNAEFKEEDLIKAFRFEKFYPAEGVWKPLAPSTQTFNPTSGTLTISFGADAPGARDIVRYMIDPYLIVSSKKAGGDRGTTIRASYDQSANTDRNGNISKNAWVYLGPFDNPSPTTPNLTIKNATLLTADPTLTVSGFRGNYFIDLEVDISNPGGTPFNQVLNLDTLRTSGNIRVFQKTAIDGASNYNGEVEAEIRIDPSKITMLSGTKFRVYLPANYAPTRVSPTSGNFGNLELRIYNVVLNFNQGSASGTSATAYFFKPNGGVDDTGAYRFEVKFL